MMYRGFDIRKSASKTNYHYLIYKGKHPYSQLGLTSIKAAIRVIDTYLKNGGGIETDIFIKKPNKIVVEPYSEPPPKPTTVREVYLSEHEKYINKLLDEK